MSVSMAGVGDTDDIGVVGNSCSTLYTRTCVVSSMINVCVEVNVFLVCVVSTQCESGLTCVSPTPDTPNQQRQKQRLGPVCGGYDVRVHEASLTRRR